MNRTKLVVLRGVPPREEAALAVQGLSWAILRLIKVDERGPGPAGDVEHMTRLTGTLVA